MIVGVVWILLSLTVLARSALVRSYACSGLKEEDFSFEPLVSEVYYDIQEEMLRFNLITNVTEYTIDINTTTNMYTTLHVQIEFTGGQILSKYLRLCEYVKRLPPQDLPFPYPNSSLPYNYTSSSSSAQSSIISSSTSGVRGGILASVEATLTSPVVGQASETTAAVPTVEASTTDTGAVVVAPTATPEPQTVIPLQVNGKREFDEVLVPRDNEDDGGIDDNICPLLQNELIEIRYNMSIGKYHKFGSYDLRFSIISADSSQTIIGCNRFYVTPELPTTATRGIAIGVLVLAVWMAAMSFLTLVFSPYQESQNPFLLFCSTICNAPLLNQLSPLFDDFVVYVHYMFFMAALDVQYPGFYQPLIASIRWLVLVNSSFQTDSRKPVRDNIYVTYGTDSLGSLMLFSTSDGMGYSWSNFIELFAAMMAVILLVTFLSTLALWLRNRHNADYQGFQSKIFFHTFGLFVRFLFFVFAMPFLILTIGLWSSSGDQGINKEELGIGAVFFVGWVATACYFIIKYIFIARNRPRLYSSLKVILLWSLLYHKYDPSKVYYFIVEVLEILIISLVIGVLGNYGAVQVSIIIIVQSLSLLCLIFVKPFYLKTKLNTSKMTIGISKLIIAILTIPYIRELNISEKDRTYIAYLESFFHLFVIIVIFFLPSLYCSVVTIMSIIKDRRGNLDFDEKNDADVPLSNKNSYANIPPTNSLHSFSYNNEFSYYRQPHQVTTDLPWQKALHRNNSDISSSTTNLGLTDERALPFIGLAAADDNLSDAQKVDYSVREVDKFYNASRILEPDPEVKQLWEAREGRRQNNNNNVDLDDVTQLSASPKEQSPFQYTAYLQEPQQKRQPKLLTWFFQRKAYKPVKRGFEVERPRQLIVDRSSQRVFDDLATTDIGSSILMKEETYEDSSSETATKISLKNFEEDEDSGVEDKLLNNEVTFERRSKMFQHEIIAEENEEENLSRVNSSGSDAEFVSIQNE